MASKFPSQNSSTRSPVTCASNQRTNGPVTRHALQRKASVEMIDVGSVPNTTMNDGQDDDDDMKENDDDGSDVHAPSSDKLVGNEARECRNFSDAASRYSSIADKDQGAGLISQASSMKEGQSGMNCSVTQSTSTDTAQPASPTSVSSGPLESEPDIAEDDSNYDAIDNLSQPSGTSSMDIERQDEAALLNDVEQTRAIDWHDPATYEENRNPEASQYSHGILYGFKSPQFPANSLHDNCVPDFSMDELPTAPRTSEHSVLSDLETHSSIPSKNFRQNHQRGDSAAPSANVADEDNDSDPTEDEGYNKSQVNPGNGWHKPLGAIGPHSSGTFGSRRGKPCSPIAGKIQKLPRAKQFSFEAGHIVVSTRRVPKCQILRMKWPKDTNKGWASGAKEHKHKIAKPLPPIAIENTNPPEIKDSVMSSLFKSHFGRVFAPMEDDSLDILSPQGQATLLQRSEASLAFAGGAFHIPDDGWIQRAEVESEIDEHIGDVSQLIDLDDDQPQEVEWVENSKIHGKSVKFTEPVADNISSSIAMEGAAHEDLPPLVPSTMEHNTGEILGPESAPWNEANRLSGSADDAMTVSTRQLSSSGPIIA